ncbi:hypothetical protein CJ030_MR8G028352 [Morella rubra]|uniref:Uncharacterized protein n=1 Tax=Morella rubra TaxID=262757 RepID=A0A6A1UUR9_9ROSI|nr:hypothetical protein CJ030_MR8G028352 [Morella rubra]
MPLGLDLHFNDSHSPEKSGFAPNLFSYTDSHLSLFLRGGLYLEPTIPSTFVNLISSRSSSISVAGSVSSCVRGRKPVVFGRERSVAFLTVSLKSDDLVRESKVYLVQNREEGSERAASHEGADAAVEQEGKQKARLRRGYAMNTTKHLWAGAIAAMVSRSVSVFIILDVCQFAVSVEVYFCCMTVNCDGIEKRNYYKVDFFFNLLYGRLVISLIGPFFRLFMHSGMADSMLSNLCKPSLLAFNPLYAIYFNTKIQQRVANALHVRHVSNV